MLQIFRLFSPADEAAPLQRTDSFEVHSNLPLETLSHSSVEDRAGVCFIRIEMIEEEEEEGEEEEEKKGKYHPPNYVYERNLHPCNPWNP